MIKFFAIKKIDANIIEIKKAGGQNILFARYVLKNKNCRTVQTVQLRLILVNKIMLLLIIQ